jgi:signal transduction histidine kinase
MEQELYRIAQEALNNILKYSEASLVSVSLRGLSGFIELEVDDNGVGFDVLSLESSCGIGLVSMRERTEKLGGCFSVTSKPGKGTRVWVRVPDDACSKPVDVKNTSQ